MGWTTKWYIDNFATVRQIFEFVRCGLIPIMISWTFPATIQMGFPFRSSPRSRGIPNVINQNQRWWTALGSGIPPFWIVVFSEVWLPKPTAMWENQITSWFVKPSYTIDISQTRVIVSQSLQSNLAKSTVCWSNHRFISIDWTVQNPNFGAWNDHFCWLSPSRTAKELVLAEMSSVPAIPSFFLAFRLKINHLEKIFGGEWQVGEFMKMSKFMQGLEMNYSPLSSWVMWNITGHQSQPLLWGEFTITCWGIVCH